MSFSTVRLAGLALCFPVLLSAQTIVQNFTFGPSALTSTGATSVANSYNNTINQFNPALGTLDNVTLSFSFSYSGSVTNGAAGGGGGAVGSGAFAWNGAFIDSLGNPGTSGSGGPFQSYNLSGTVTYAEQTLPGFNYATALGTGTANLAYGTSVSVNGLPSGATVNAFNLTGGTLALTYYYTAAAIPEPGTYALLAGLAGLGVVVWRRRTTPR
jgi:hypothetical protein